MSGQGGDGRGIVAALGQAIQRISRKSDHSREFVHKSPVHPACSKRIAVLT